jgi:hypothetical protein
MAGLPQLHRKDARRSMMVVKRFIFLSSFAEVYRAQIRKG